MPLSLPKIYLTSKDLNPGTTTWDLLQGDVLRALEEYGCFEAVYGNETDTLHGSVMFHLEEVFNLLSETKQRYVEPGKPYFGYLWNLLMLPLYEAIGITRVLNSPAVQRLADIFWPEHGNPKFFETMNLYARKVLELHVLVKKLVFDGLGVKKYFDSIIDSMTYSVRLNKYAAPNTMEAQLGAGIHRDKNFLTILQQNDIDGLEVETKDGRWIRATPSHSTFIVMVGESLIGWCNGRLRCPRHRVIMTGREVRYSIGIFSALEGMIRCPKELIDKEHPVLYKPFDEIALLHCVRVTEEGHEAEPPLKACCNV